MFGFHEASLYDKADQSVVRLVEQDIADSAKPFTGICRDDGLPDQITGALCHIVHLQGVQQSRRRPEPRAWLKRPLKVCSAAGTT